jgi:predicted dehydrogenase
MAEMLRWGIVGTGMIAEVFAKGLEQAQRGRKAAVASRSADRAKAFAAKHGIPRAYGSYEALCADPDINAVYVATPHPCHRDVVLAAAAAGKHILCEKPLGVTASECSEMIAVAKAAGVTLLEAFMYRVHPQTALIQHVIRDGRIGQVKLIRSAFCYGLGDAYNVRLDKVLRGGGLYDVGCYCINFSRMVAGEEPDDIAAVWTLGAKTGVDESLACGLRFPTGIVAHFDVSVRSTGSAYAEILGTTGSLLVPNPWRPHPDRAEIELRCQGQAPQTLTCLAGGQVFPLEADHLAAVVQDGVEPLIPAANAIGNAAVLDTIWQRMHGRAEASA